MKKPRKPLPIIETRTCVRCGAEYGITKQQLSKRYCDGCKKIHDYERRHTTEYAEKRKEYMKWYNHNVKLPRYKPVRHEVTCVRCGQAFVIGSGRPTKICINCLMSSSNSAERARGYVRRDYSAEE